MNTLANVLLAEFRKKYGNVIEKNDVVDYLMWLGDLSLLYKFGCKVYTDYLFDWATDYGLI